MASHISDTSDAPIQDARRAVVMDSLAQAGMRLTRVRRKLIACIFPGYSRHFTAEQIHADLTDAGIRLSLASVYNFLGVLMDLRMIRTLPIHCKCRIFDNNFESRCHFAIIGTEAEIFDPAKTDEVKVEALSPSSDLEIASYDVLIWLRPVSTPSSAQARAAVTAWRQDYNWNRPHSSPGNITPASSQ